MVITAGSGFPTAVTLTNNQNGTATISGTPASGTAGTSGSPASQAYPVTLTANNGVSPSFTQNFTLNVTCPAIIVNGAGSLDLQGNTAMTPSTYEEGGGNGTIVWSATGLPTGLSINSSNGQLSGTPVSSNAFSAMIIATDAGGCTGSKSVTIDVGPIASGYTYSVLGNVEISVPASAGLTSSDLGAPFTISAYDAISANGGSVSVTESGGNAGAFTYNPSAGFTGNDTFTYTITNSYGSSTATVDLKVSGMIWFINNAATAGNGTLNSPFNSLAAFQAVNDGVGRHPASGQSIFIYQGTANYTGPLTLLNGQYLIGQGATSSIATITGLTIPTYSVALPTATSSPTLTGTITLFGSTTVWGLNLSTGASTGLSGSGGASNITTRQLAITTTTGTAVSLNDTLLLNMIIDSINTNGAANGISLTHTTGSFDVEGGGPSDPTNTTKGRTTAAQGGGTLTLGSGGTIQNTTGAGVFLSDATNVTLRNMTIENNGGTGVNNGGDGINASGSSSLTLDNILITGQAGNAGLYASSLAGLSIQHTQISSNATNSSLAGDNLFNVTFGEVTCTTCPDGLTGTATVANSIFDTSYQNTFGMENHNSSTVSLTVTNSQFSNAGGYGLESQANDSANVTINVSGSAVQNNVSGGIVYAGLDSSGGGTTTVTSSTFDQNGSNEGDDISVNHQGQGQTYTFDIESNTTRQTFVSNSENSIAAVVQPSANSSTVLQGKILNNTIGNASVAGSGSANWSGIAFETRGPGTLTALVTGNTVVQTGLDGLSVVGSSSTTSAINVTASGNDFEVNASNADAYLGVQLTTGYNGGSDIMCANISGNSKEIGNSAKAGIATQVLGSSIIQLQGYTGAANDNTAIASFLNGTATTVSPTAVNYAGGGTVEKAASSCPTPP
jgi:hypothetical protein